jgi:hypothetical protein
MKEFKLPKVFNWQLASQPIIKKYIASLYQSGLNEPVATELVNNTDVSFTYLYFAPGAYGVISSKPLFIDLNSQKVQVTITNATYVNDISGPNGQSIIVFPASESTILILTSNLTAEVNDILGNYTQNTIEITIYP